MQQDVVVGARLILIAHELERAVERLDRRFDRAFGVAPAQPHLVAVVIQLLEADVLAAAK